MFLEHVTQELYLMVRQVIALQVHQGPHLPAITLVLVRVDLQTHHGWDISAMQCLHLPHTSLLKSLTRYYKVEPLPQYITTCMGYAISAHQPCKYTWENSVSELNYVIIFDILENITNTFNPYSQFQHQKNFAAPAYFRRRLPIHIQS